MSSDRRNKIVDKYIEPTKPGYKEGFDTKTSPKGFYSIKARLDAKEGTWSTS